MSIDNNNIKIGSDSIPIGSDAKKFGKDIAQVMQKNIGGGIQLKTDDKGLDEQYATIFNTIENTAGVLHKSLKELHEEEEPKEDFSSRKSNLNQDTQIQVNQVNQLEEITNKINVKDPTSWEVAETFIHGMVPSTVNMNDVQSIGKAIDSLKLLQNSRKDFSRKFRNCQFMEHLLRHQITIDKQSWSIGNLEAAIDYFKEQKRKIRK